jgi:Amt family ammonium transporter
VSIHFNNYKLTAFSDYIAHLDGVTVISGGWINHNYIQLGYQLADSVTGFAYSFVVTCIILFIMNLIPGLSLRAPEEDEILGIDDAEIGEFAVSSTSKHQHTIHSMLTHLSSTTTSRLLVTLSTALRTAMLALSVP